VPSTQVKVMLSAALAETTSVSVVGASGYVIKTPLSPAPGRDSCESPYELCAITLAYTLVPHGKLNGADLSVRTSIVHLEVLFITGLEPSH